MKRGEEVEQAALSGCAAGKPLCRLVRAQNLMVKPGGEHGLLSSRSLSPSLPSAVLDYRYSCRHCHRSAAGPSLPLPIRSIDRRWGR